MAEFRRIRPVAAEQASGGVELSLSSPIEDDAFSAHEQHIELAGRTGQAIRVPGECVDQRVGVRSLAASMRKRLRSCSRTWRRAGWRLCWPPCRKSCRPKRLNGLSALGETDPESVTVLERELAVVVGHARRRPWHARAPPRDGDEHSGRGRCEDAARHLEQIEIAQHGARRADCAGGIDAWDEWR